MSSLRSRHLALRDQVPEAPVNLALGVPVGPKFSPDLSPSLAFYPRFDYLPK